MQDEPVLIFESTEAAIVRAVETALTRAKLAFELRFERPTLATLGPNKKPKQFFVAPSIEAKARELVEAAVLRRTRVVSLQPKAPPTGSGFADGGGGSIGIYGFDLGGGDFSGTD